VEDNSISPIVGPYTHTLIAGFFLFSPNIPGLVKFFVLDSHQCDSPVWQLNTVLLCKLFLLVLNN